MKVNTQKAKQLIKLTLLVGLLTYAAFFFYGAIMAYDFCNGPRGPANSSERSACFQLNHDAYQRMPLLIDHPAFENCSFSKIKHGNYWATLNCLDDKQNNGLFSPMDEVQSACTTFNNQSYKEILECIATDREARARVLENTSHPYYVECSNQWHQYSHIEMCMSSPAWRK
ncbi:hypothetical protein HNE05_18360 [Aquipseudomonas campi]|uniref:Uncharacterized protein n=1 Tax=Aquipseudomonas campi TaxID=2731681 RepID=A0A6M8G8R7_9GAMM|nr:hypothetical protein [Pseudomonas campi]QKE65235.1 hypothetical protein HNE05_18360 [Pseudomonas campi]